MSETEYLMILQWKLFTEIEQVMYIEKVMSIEKNMIIEKVELELSE